MGFSLNRTLEITKFTGQYKLQHNLKELKNRFKQTFSYQSCYNFFFRISKVSQKQTQGDIDFGSLKPFLAVQSFKATM